MKKKALKLSDEDIALLNTPIGLKHLLATDKTDVESALATTEYELKLREMQRQLILLQNWAIESGQRIVVLFEGRDAAGKGGAIRRITAHINPRHFRIVALPKPTEEEKGQWYFQRYVSELPKPGEIVFFDRSWYNRAVVEPVNGFCTDEEYAVFMSQINGFEKMIVDSGAHLIKLYFSITKKEQEKRFNEISKSPLKRWKMTTVDKKAQGLWNCYTSYRKKMLEETNPMECPWDVIDANDKSTARLHALQVILDRIPYSQ